MSFTKLSVRDLKHIIATYKREHCLSNYSKLRKAQLIELLEKKFIIKDNRLILKPVQQPISIQRKRIIPQLVASSYEPVMTQQQGLTTGQQTYVNTVDTIANKTKAKKSYLKNKKFAERIREI